jgi:ATP-dependent Clp protease protease subunit
MTLRALPEISALNRPKNFQADAPGEAFDKWAAQPKAAGSGSDDVITIFDVIGEDWWTGEGFTVKRCAAALRSIGDRDVRVQINTPGGDMFEGLAIYNLLRSHKAKVTVEVVGLAASAGSIIAMAGDEIVMGLGSFIMVHNAWGVVVGNRHELADAAKTFEQFDSALVDIYEARTEQGRPTLQALMDAETFMGPNEAIKNGFADRLDNDLGADLPDANNSDRSLMARRQTEAALAKAGHSRTARQEILSELQMIDLAQRDASRNLAARDAGVSLADVSSLIDFINS